MKKNLLKVICAALVMGAAFLGFAPGAFAGS